MNELNPIYPMFEENEFFNDINMNENNQCDHSMIIYYNNGLSRCRECDAEIYVDPNEYSSDVSSPIQGENTSSTIDDEQSDYVDDDMNDTKEKIDEFDRMYKLQKSQLDEIDINISFNDAQNQRFHRLNFMKELEKKYQCYDSNATYLKYRRVLVDYMCETGNEFGFFSITTHLSIAYFDRFLSTTNVSKNNLQIVALICLMLAAKHEEQESYVPQLKKINMYTNYSYSIDTIRDMEAHILQALQWKLCSVVPLHFVQYYLCCDLVFDEDKCNGQSADRNTHRRVRRYVDFFIDICQQEYEFTKHLPSVIAATVIAASRRAMLIEPIWNMKLTQMTGYETNDLYPCFHQLITYSEKHYPTLFTANTANMNNSPNNINEITANSNSNNNNIQATSETFRF